MVIAMNKGEKSFRENVLSSQVINFRLSTALASFTLNAFIFHQEKVLHSIELWSKTIRGFSMREE